MDRGGEGGKGSRAVMVGRGRARDERGVFVVEAEEREGGFLRWCC